MITSEQFNTIPEEERDLITSFFHEIGIDFNRHMADCIALMEEGIGIPLFEMSVKALRNEFYDKWRDALEQLDEECESVIVKDFYITDTNLDKLTCKVVPDLELVEG